MPSRQDLANAVRFLSMDAVEKAKSGHPGMPMGMADIAQVLWCDFLKHAPTHPRWCNRDRFVLSNGHGSMLLYSVLHLTGYDVTLDDLKQFRQLHSKTPGHPEFLETPGVDTTTGPLGNGIANAVGMALAERKLAAEFNRPGFDVVDHYTYAFMGDGCLMEGLSHEVCSLAGTQQLGKLIAFWDDNNISIDGEVGPWFSEDVPKRFEAYGWQVIQVDGHDGEAVHSAIKQAKLETVKPSLICCKTIIGHGAPNKAGTSKTHGAPLGEAEIAATREALGWPYPAFEVPDSLYEAWDHKQKGEALYSWWQDLFSQYQQAHPELAREFIRRMEGRLPTRFDKSFEEWLKSVDSKKETVATRKASQQTIEFMTPELPELIGGSADLSCSNLTSSSHTSPIRPDNPNGNYIDYGVREFGMSAIMNGISLHGGLIPFGGTFLVFSDYARNAVRLSALMKQRVIYVYTHDSIGVGEDGPTHEPIEQLASLRMIPNIHVWRPCDAVETAIAWRFALNHETGPTLLALSRQNLKAQSHQDLSDISKGGYILADTAGTPDLIIMATGSEVELAMEAREKLAQQDVAVRVVSMPCLEVFKAQPQAYQSRVLPQKIKRIAVEAGVKATWFGLVDGPEHVLGLETFGLSAPGPQVYEAMGLTVNHLVKLCSNTLKQTQTEV